MKALMLCAWCNGLIGDAETPDGQPSHGICDSCLKTVFPDLHHLLTDTTQAYDDAQPAAADSERIDAQ